MKTINLTVYSFDDLSKDIQKQIIERERWNVMEQCMSDYRSDYQASLDRFEKLMNISVSQWNVDYSGYGYNVRIDTKIIHEWEYKQGENEIYDCIYLENLSGKLLVRHLQNHILQELLTRKCYHVFQYIDGKPIGKRRYSKIIKECSCPLTGYCYDMYLIDPILKYLQNPTPTTTYEDLMNECIESFFNCWHEEYEYWGDNEDAICERLHQNQYEDQLYYKNGQVYNGPLEDVA